MSAICPTRAGNKTPSSKKIMNLMTDLKQRINKLSYRHKNKSMPLFVFLYLNHYPVLDDGGLGGKVRGGL